MILFAFMISACVTQIPADFRVDGVYRSKGLPGYHELHLQSDSSFQYALVGCFGPLHTMEGVWHRSSSGVDLVPTEDSSARPEDPEAWPKRVIATDFLHLRFLSSNGEIYLSPDRVFPWTQPDPYFDLRRVQVTNAAAANEAAAPSPLCEEKSTDPRN
jgi:hypothetical protein